MIKQHLYYIISITENSKIREQPHSASAHVITKISIIFFTSLCSICGTPQIQNLWIYLIISIFLILFVVYNKKMSPK